MELQTLVQRKRRGPKIIAWTAAIILILASMLVLFVSVYTSRSLPKTSGTITLEGLVDEVEVIRDSSGVPHIKASNEQDLYMAQGYIQAQDRLFQMDLSRRQASGRLSEVVGEQAVDRDKFFRTLGLRRAAEASVDIHSEQAINVLNWYAEGVNQFIEEAKNSGKLPVEFTLLGYEPEKWTPIDSLTIGKYMAFDLGGHWQGQAFRLWALENLPEDKALDVFPSYPEEAPTILSYLDEIDIPVEKAFASAIIPPEFNGSNNWVVSGDKTASGKPILADDPHLALNTPSIWYQMHLQAPEVNVSGVIFSGIPGIILGHNEQIAWGVTNTGPDVQDLYIEKQNPDEPTEFLYDGKWEKATVIDEPIKVKGSETIPYEVMVTRHGPVISEFAYEQDNQHLLSLQWTALEPSLELQAVMEMNKAKTWDEFETALADFHVPTQNFVFASQDGTIAYKANGKIPIRKKGDGLLPVPGWDSSYGWDGYIPYDELPRIVNPTEGFVATANNKVIGDDYPYHISHHWAQPYRFMRISEVLQENDNITVEDMQALQMDQINLHAREFVPIMIDALSNQELSNDEEQIVELLFNWETYKDDKDLAAPLVFHTWMNKISTKLFEEDISEEAMNLFAGKQSVVDELIRKASSGTESPWFKEQGGFDKYMKMTFSQTIEELKETYGEDSTQWKWGDYHQVYFAHPLSSASEFIKPFFNQVDPVPVGGSRVTVQAASYNAEGITNHGASWRFVIDTSNMTEGYHIVGPGQSGHFKSKWYDDQTDDWVEGTYHKTNIKEQAKTDDTLTLIPEN